MDAAGMRARIAPLPAGSETQTKHDPMNTEITSATTTATPAPIWFGEYRNNEYYEFPGLRGIWNRTMNCATRCTPGYEWRHEPLTPAEVAALEAAARACGFLD